MNDHVRPSNARNYIEKALIARNPIDEQERKLADLYTSSGKVLSAELSIIRRCVKQLHVTTKLPLIAVVVS